MLLTPWTRTWVSPFDKLLALQRDLDRAFGDTETMESGSFVPPMDVIETTDEILCRLEVPGMSREDLQIRSEGNVLTVSGEKKYQRLDQEKPHGFRSIERRYGHFERSFALPRSVNANTVKAHYDNGVLTIVLPKAEESKPRAIEIQVGNSGHQLNR